jgi:hypothetical protein
MAASSISPVTQQRIAVFVPIIALVLSLFVVYPAYGRYNATRAKIDKKKVELETLRNTPLPPATNLRPTADDLPSEPPQFLGQINAIAAATRCEMPLFDISSSTSTAVAPDKESPIRALRGKVEIDADYPRIRAFLVELSRASRLFVVTGLEITPNKPSMPGGSTNEPLHAKIEIERYVAPPDTAAVNPAK